MKKLKIHAYPYIKSYRWRSIFIRYLITFMLSIALPFSLLTVIIFSSVSSTYHKDLRFSLESSVNSYTYSIESILNNINTNANLISINDYILTYLVTDNSTDSNLYFYNLGQRVSELFDQFLLTNPHIHSIQLYNKTNDKISSFGEKNYIDYTYIFNEYSKVNMADCTLSHNLKNGNTYIKTITIYREISLSSKSVGVLAVNLDAEKLFKSLSKNSTESPLDNFVLLSTNGDFLYSLSEIKAIDISDFDIDSITEHTSLLESNKNNFHFATRIKNLPYILIVSFANNISVFSHLWLLELISIIILLLISFILAYNLSIYFYNSLSGILSIVEKTSHSSTAQEEKDEISFLNKTIMDIIQKNEEYELELAKKTLSFQQSQMYALQMQINPHFIFNTLQLASTMSIAMLKKDTPVSKILSMLAELVHAVYQVNEYLIPLSQELHYSKTYMQIQSMRYNDSFNVEWDISEDTLDCHIIKFSMQPILENAITHGLMPLGCNGTIRVSAFKENNALIIKVNDDGVGISYSKLTIIRNALKLESLPDGKNIGLRNTQQRIQNVFGIDYGISIDSGGFGTTITINLPCI